MHSSAISGFEPHPTVAIALSGGADSMALALLAQQWLQPAGGKVVALTVDHGIRAESAAEALQVGAWMRDLGIEHHILTLDTPITRDVQATARALRYEALENWCRDHHVLHLLTAHHAGDVEETIAMRVWRGSGVDGLSGIPAIRFTRHIRIIRPLLGMEKENLKAYLMAHGWPWLEDPSNASDDYERNTVRKNLQTWPLPAGQVARFASTMALARQVLEQNITQLLARSFVFYPDGTATLDLSYWRSSELRHSLEIPSPCQGEGEDGGYVPTLLTPTPTLTPTLTLPLAEGGKCAENLTLEEIACPALGRIITFLSGAQTLPRYHDLQTLYRTLHRDHSTATTLGGLLFERSQKKNSGDMVHICREPERIASTEWDTSTPHLWDRRFLINAIPCAPKTKPHLANVTIKPLGEAGLMRLKQERVPFPTHLTYHGKVGLLSIWRLDLLAAVPHIGYWNQATAFPVNERPMIRFFPVRPLAATPNRYV